jgi:hypothetical protein
MNGRQSGFYQYLAKHEPKHVWFGCFHFAFEGFANQVLFRAKICDVV